jgi:hypothetical protein
MTTPKPAGIPPWTRAEQLVAVLRRRWETGIYLKAYASGDPWQPIILPVRAPGAGDLLQQLDAARRWIAQFERDTRRFCVEYRAVQSRHIGTNRIPARVKVESFEQLCRILSTQSDVGVLDGLIVRTRSQLPELVGWIEAHPMLALGNAAVWDQALATVQWLAAHDTVDLYIRQIDVEGVDTKFVETHHKLLDHLLTVVLPTVRIDELATHSTFVKRFRFLDKPSYTRFRILDPTFEAVQSGFTEMTVRTDELAQREPAASTVFVVENEVTFLAFPRLPNALLVFGSGFAVGGLVDLPWLHEKEIVYWGDIDTHGFDILNRLRTRFASVRSILMNRDTLLAHRRQWVTEPNPTSRSLVHLSADETALYTDLVEGTFGSHLRLEQERVRFSTLARTLRPWSVRGQACQGARQS